MATEKVMITISGLQDHEVILASDSHPDKTLHQVDFFQAADSLPGTSERSKALSHGATTKVPLEAAKAAVEGARPWELASSDPTAINFRPDVALHAKMEWVCENVPRCPSCVLRARARSCCARCSSRSITGTENDCRMCEAAYREIGWADARLF